ncbi:phosphogluconate dehydrogenase C-terminal domain-containing protein [Shouchella patagoniensis]|uniref:phosphogluconate dehydrogenase C-terminal domain-containing protein n=1 Tax=Shouchella patagoniensis TaxID=228576 RepID=UPI000994F7C4|nr:phosphogluconate dehydrogenase C-terminal domain-containing protein [Shouchella patagoniensis]
MKKKQITLIGAGGKMGTRITANLIKNGGFITHFCESSANKKEELATKGIQVREVSEVVPDSDFIILATPDTVLGPVSAQVVPMMKPDAVLITLDPAAAYANLLADRDEITSVVAHPCHPSVFGKHLTEEEHADFFGGIAAKQDVVAAKYSGKDSLYEQSKEVIRSMYAPVETVHTITVKQMAILEPTLAEVITCMIGTVLNESLEETVKKGVPEEAAKAMLYGHIQIALAVALKGTNPFSDACMVAIEYGKEAIIKEDWKRVFDDEALDHVLKEMLHLDHAIQR